MNVVHLIDDTNYVENNCYQHQLLKSLREVCPTIRTVTVVELTQIVNNVDLVISCLKQRTLFRLHEQVRRFVNDVPLVVYDQDPWQAYMDDSPYKNTYKLLNWPNLKSIAVTTEWWADYIKNDGLPGKFVRMGILPQYCSIGPSFNQRKFDVGFIGTMHPRRAKLTNELNNLGINVFTKSNSLNYSSFLNALHDIGIFIHNEDAPIMINGKRDNMGRGLWIKDVEAAARGCFSIRNKFEGHQSYCENIPTIFLYDDPIHARELINIIRTMPNDLRNKLQNEAVEYIRTKDHWRQTAIDLIS